MDALPYRNRHIVVTGGTGALGTAVVGALLGAGAICHVPCRTEGELQSFAHRDHPNIVMAPGTDLTAEVAVTALYEGLPTLWASIHLAGGFAAAPIETIDRAALMQQLETNLISAFLCCRAAVMAMKRTQGEGGRIVNVAARPALEWRGGANMLAYAASKAAVAAFTVGLAEEVADDGILVNAVAPSIMDTPANRKAMPKADHAAWPKVDEVAQTILFLASPDNAVTRGAIIPVYGRT